MSQLQTFHLSHLPPSTAVHVALYRDLQNASFLREQLLSGNTDFEYALIDASMVCLQTASVFKVSLTLLDTLNNPRSCSSV